MVRVVDNFRGLLKTERVKGVKMEAVAHSFHKLVFEREIKRNCYKGSMV